MERKLLLQKSKFPAKFEEIEVNPANGISKQKYVEDKIIQSINEYNYKLNISSIEYDDIQNQFKDIRTSDFTGVIIEEIEIKETEKDRYDNEKYFLLNSGDKWLVRRILTYVFFSDSNESSRSSLFTQSIFPTTIDYMMDFISSPSYTIVNHPIYFVNIINKKITANSLIKRLASFIVLGFEYIEVFNNNTINSKEVPIDVKNFIKKYDNTYKEDDLIFSSNFFEVNFDLKTIKIKTDKLVVGDFLKQNASTGKISFNGSSEKFYWMEILPIIICGCNNDYKIDFSDLEYFYNSNVNNFSSRDDKIKRFPILIEYIKKITFS